jgi:hypothetical protein
MPSRRDVLKIAALLPAATVEARDYASAGEVFSTIDGLEAGVAQRLQAVARALPAAQAFVASLLVDQERHRADRQRLRRRLGLAGGGERSPTATAITADLAALRTAQEALMHAHAEGAPALGDRAAVDVFAHHIVDLSRHLTVIDLWIETETQRG